MIDHLLVPTGSGPRPPEDGFDRVLRGARRRRWRTLRNNAVCGTAAAAVIAVAASPHLTSGSVSGLEPAAPGVRRTYAGEPRSMGGSATPSPRAEASPTAEPGAPADTYGGGYGAANAGGSGAAPRRGPGTTPGGPSPTPSAMPGGGQVHGPPASTGTGDLASPLPTASIPTPGPTSPPAPNPPPQEPVDQGYEDQSVSAPCEASTWCLSAQVLGATNAGIRTLKLTACRTASDTNGVIHFTTENEADFRVVRDGRVLWQWSVGEPDPAYAHDVPVDRWQCATWTTQWYITDQDGYAATPGRYQLDAMSRSTNVSNAWRSTAFDVT
jgi:hypothetical protein